MTKFSIKKIVFVVTAMTISGLGAAQSDNSTDLTGQDVSVDALVNALNIPVRGIEAKCSPYQEQMTRLTRGIGVNPSSVKKAEDVPALKTAKIANISATFGLNSAELTSETKMTLDTVAAALNSEQLVAQCFQLAGHTCDLGDDAYNMDLSRRRADSVRTYLVSLGVDADRLVTTGYGETAPMVENKTESDRMKNRRVEFGALPPAALEFQ